MPNNTAPTPNNEEELPFFARFLVEQVSQEEEEGDEPPPFPPIYTLKYPSDWEDR